jgi:PAS domain S-box-containing protein
MKKNEARSRQDGHRRKQSKTSAAGKKSGAESAYLAAFPTLNPNPIAEADLEGRIHYLNPAAERLFPDLRRRGPDHPWLRNWESLANIFRDGATKETAREVNSGGRWFLQTIYFIKDSGRLRIYGEEITEQKRDKAKIEESGRLLEALMEYLPEGIAFADAPDAKIKRVSRYGRDVLGMPPEGISVADFEGRLKVYHKDGITPMADADLPLIRAISKGETIRNEELVQITATAQSLAISCSAAPIRNAGGSIIGGITTWRNVTELRQAERALQESEKRYRSMVNGITEGFALHEILCDTDGNPCGYRFLEINPAFERLTGLKREDVIGRLNNEALPGEDPHWVEVFGQVALTGRSIHFTRYSQALQRHYEVFAYCPAPRQFATLFLDVTDRMQAEEALRREREVMDSVMKVTDVLLAYLDPDFNFVTVNAAYAEAGRNVVVGDF